MSQVINCGQYVGHLDVSTYIRKHDLKGQDRKLLQGCYNLFESKPDFVWRNCAIEVLCPSVDVKFVSGNQSNRYVLRFKEGDTLLVVMKEGSRTKLYAAHEWLFAHVKRIGDAVGEVIRGTPPVPPIGNFSK